MINSWTFRYFSLTTLPTRCLFILALSLPAVFSMHLLYYSLVVFLSSAFLHQSTTFCSSQSHCHTSSHHTASQQYSYLNRTTFAAALLFTRSRCLRFRSLFLLLFVLLSGDIELYPGPSAFTLCTLNIRSILHPLHSTALSDLIDTHNPDLFCLTETWIKPITTAAELLNCTPPHYSLLSTPRNSFNKNSSSGGGTAFLIREPFTQLPTSVPDFSSFESSSVTLQLSHSKLSIVLHLRRLILNHSLSSSMTSVPFSPPLQLHPMNLSSPVTLTFISIILQILSPLTFCLSSLLSILVNMSTSPHTTKVTFLI